MFTDVHPCELPAVAHTDTAEMPDFLHFLHLLHDIQFYLPPFSLGNDLLVCLSAVYLLNPNRDSGFFRDANVSLRYQFFLDIKLHH